MSRAIKLSLGTAEMMTQCMAAGVGISAIKSLRSGGTRLVCTTSEGADEIRLRFQRHIISREGE